ncbi:MAG: hypothetical protein JWM25_57 [Thermoleophilia bacterium]|nr:hypothetical protein [Thermoleophilia bacterium]MCZ4495474.1 hypothetical protein [Thermoleophilia bacterium]
MTTFRLLRALWRYRGRIEAHGDRYQVELATAVRTALDRQLVGRVALRGYRIAMRALVVGAAVAGLLALVVAWLLWQVEPWAALAALLPLALCVLIIVWRFAYGAPLDWLDEFADPTRQVSPRELPGVLRELATELRDVADVPANISRELDSLADDAAADIDGAIQRH